MKVAIISNNTSDIIRTRGELIKAIIEKGHEVVAIGNEDVDEEKFKKLGIKAKNIRFDGISTNILQNVKYIIKLTKVLKEEHVDVILAYTPKPIICGAIAGKFAKVKKSYSLFAGFGYHYSINTIKTVFARLFCDIGYRIACKLNKKIIVQNIEDKQEIIKRRFSD